MNNEKIRKTFSVYGIELRIVDRDEPYMGGTSVRMTRVVNSHGLLLPMRYKHKQTLKALQQTAIEFIEAMKKRGCDVVKELNKGKIDVFYDLAASRNLPRSVNLHKAKVA